MVLTISWWQQFEPFYNDWSYGTVARETNHGIKKKEALPCNPYLNNALYPAALTLLLRLGFPWWTRHGGYSRLIWNRNKALVLGRTKWCIAVLNITIDCMLWVLPSRMTGWKTIHFQLPSAWMKYVQAEATIQVISLHEQPMIDGIALFISC